MSISLLIDTSNKELAVGIATNINVIDSIQYEAWQKQSELTIVEIDKLFKRNNINPKQITRVIVANGPGSYTGIRIGLTIAKVYATALKIPLCVVSSLNMLSGNKGKKIALIDARSKRAYIGIYNNGLKVIDDTVLPLEEIKRLLDKYQDYEVVGDSFLLNIESVKIDYIKNLFDLSKLINDIENPHLAVPIYLKD